MLTRQQVAWDTPTTRSCEGPSSCRLAASAALNAEEQRQIREAGHLFRLDAGNVRSGPPLPPLAKASVVGTDRARAGELRQSARRRDLRFVFATGMDDHGRYQFAQRARDRFIPLDQSARQRRGKIVNRA